ncbi:MAG: hypothetical protein K2W88_14105 [Pararheinheimera sp.]|nr:hypothetical protein [Rheinheimera sp.]
MRTVKFKTLEDIPGHEAGDIFNVTLIFEGCMGDGLILHPTGGGVGCIETVCDSGEGYWIHDDQGFVNFDENTGQLETFLTALKIMS